MYTKNSTAVNQTESNFLSAEHYLEVVCRNSSVINRTIEQYGNFTLYDYLKNLLKKVEKPYQKRDDLVEAVYRYAAPLLGESIAKQASHDLVLYPVVLTANHHGVDYFSQSIQGSIIFSLSALTCNNYAKTVLVFSFGAISLNNSTYPRGLLLYNTEKHNEFDNMPKKLPIYSDRFKRQMVSNVNGFDKVMIIRAQARFDKMIHDRKISPTLASPLRQILWQDYCDATVMNLTNYSEQSVIVNSRIWKRIFSESEIVPKSVCIEIEKVVSILLKSDLLNPESLTWCVMFDSKLRKNLLYELDGEKACWKRKMLYQRLGKSRVGEKKEKIPDGCGTHFFWGVDDTGRRIPLYLKSDSSNNDVVLHGMDDHGKIWEFPFTFNSILKCLKEARLIPSLFTCFLTVAFARGFTCLGGYFQCKYLPIMQRGLVNALKKTGGYDNMVQHVSKVTTDGYLSGMLAVMSQIEDNYLIPAGPIEIIAGGGITKKDIEKMLSLTIQDAHMAALFETVPDITPWELSVRNWQKQLAADCFQLLKGKVVVKS
ncbi:MAG: hypothetical protein JW786_10500 [Desulfobacterales bacterium]|nr:hypothetical protein [Desulfobacterales bacterium]